MSVVGILCSSQYAAYTHAVVDGIKCSTQVDVERIIDRSCEHTHVIAQIKNSLLKQLVILRHSPRANIGRHCIEGFAFAQFRPHAVLDHHYRISLPKTQPFGTLAGQRSNLSNAAEATDKAGENIRHAD